MSDLSLDHQISEDSFDAISSPTHHLGSRQVFDDVAHTEQPRGLQQLGWMSPSAPQHPDNPHGVAGNHASSFRSAVEDHPVEPYKEDLVAELARLKAMMEVMNDRMGQIETAPTPKTPPKTVAQPVRPQTTPRKRTASRVANSAASPSKRPRSVAPGPVSIPQGTIEAMWSPGVTPDQRRAIFDSNMQSVTSTTGAMSIPFTPNPETSSPAATPNPSSTPTRKPAAKSARAVAPKKPRAPRKSAKCAKAQLKHQRTQSAPALPTSTGCNVEALKFLTPQAPRSGDRPISELYKENFMSLGLDEKARILLPLLQGNDPETGMKWDEPGSLGRELLATPQTAVAIDFSSGPFTPYMNLHTDLTASSDAAGLQSFMPTPSTEPSTTSATLSSYSTLEAWVDTLAPVTQTSTDRAFSDGESASLFSTPPATIQVPSEHASVLSQSDISSLLSYIRNDAVEALNEQNAAQDALNSDAQTPASDAQSVNASSTHSGITNSLLHDFNEQTTATDPLAFGITEATDADFSQFISDGAVNDDTVTSDPFAFDSTDATSEDFSQFINDDADTFTNDAFSLTGDTSAVKDSSLFCNNETTAFDPFAFLNTSGDFNNFHNSDAISTGMSTGLTNISTDMSSTDLTDTHSTFDMDTFSNSNIDLSHMVQQATTQIQAPDGGAKRQREACMEHERRVAEGRTR
jgi:hypothetical protein